MTDQANSRMDRDANVHFSHLENGGHVMTRKLLALVSVLAVLTLAISLSGAAAQDAGPETESSPQAASAMTGYYNLFGYEGIGTLGSTGFTAGPTPPVGDYVTTHCRYIDVQNTTLGHYYLRYPLHLPNGANITRISLFVADFNPSGVMWAYLRSRPWNSRAAGTTLGFTLTDNTANSDKTVNINFSPAVNVNNQTTEYWIDVSPQNSTAPGQLCVYGIQVTYSIDGAFLPIIQKGQ